MGSGGDRRQRDPAWLALAFDGPALELPERARHLPVRVVADVGTFVDLLERGRPTIAVIGTPPAGPQETELLARERQRRHGLRIVQLAAPDAVETRMHALRIGFDEALPTSIDAHELSSRLELLDSRAHGRPGRVLPVSPTCQLDLVAHELRRDGRLVHLRPREFDLLTVLASHPRRAYTRRQLLDQAWGPGHAADPRTVDVHMRWLRAKIEDEPDRPVHLVTVRGVGYRLDPAGALTEA